MFDAEQNLVICNRRYAEIYELPAGLTQLLARLQPARRKERKRAGE